MKGLYGWESKATSCPRIFDVLSIIKDPFPAPAMSISQIRKIPVISFVFKLLHLNSFSSFHYVEVQKVWFYAKW